MVWLGSQHAEQAGPSVVAEGILATTRIATLQGWVPASELAPGTQVMTFDAGPQPILRAQLLALSEGPAALWPVLVPPWALDNRDEITLLPEQKLLIEADLAEVLFGDPFALLPAQALEGWRGITRCRPPAGSGVVQVQFASPQILYASRAVLLSCPGAAIDATDWHTPGHTPYTLAQARHLVACMIAEEVGAALRAAGQHLPGFSA
ncbi:MAG: Hint domain-containing protein [Rhodobacteraceae bacterium]|nr:Hint domain-containing protein [Paracoccaceae bacterium]